MNYNISQFSIIKSKIINRFFNERTHLNSFRSTLALLFFLFFLIFFSCKREDNSERIQKTEYLLIELDTIDSKLDSIGLKNINEYCNTIEKNCNRIENNKNFSQNKIFLKYCNLYGNLQSFTKKNKFLQSSAKNRREQLEKLLYDLKFNPVTDDEFAMYISIETKELNKLNAKIHNNLSFVKNKIQLYDSLNLIVEKIVRH